MVILHSMSEWGSGGRQGNLRYAPAPAPLSPPLPAPVLTSINFPPFILVCVH